jgi:hypothetical protein
MQIVPYCPFFYCLIMQQIWDGQSKLHSLKKATAAQEWYMFSFILFDKKMLKGPFLKSGTSKSF